MCLEVVRYAAGGEHGGCHTEDIGVVSLRTALVHGQNGVGCLLAYIDEGHRGRCCLGLFDRSFGKARILRQDSAVCVEEKKCLGSLRRVKQ